MISMDKVKKIVLNLNSKKSSTYGAIPASILKQTIKVHLKYLTNSINHSLKESTFPDELKQSEVIPVYINFMENKISKCVTGFRKSHGTQHYLITMLEKMEKSLR